MDRKLASIQTISELRPITGADNIVVAKVLGWECVVKKSEFTRVGEPCVYFEIDSILPIAAWNDHLRKEPSKPLRVRTIRLRGQLSQGLALPITALLPDGNYPIGQDVTELIGVVKYEPVIPPQLAGLVRGNFPSFLRVTDEPRLQSYPDVLEEAKALGTPFVATIKEDGASFTAYLHEGLFGVCSRKLDLVETEGNSYWKMARKLDIENILRDYSTQNNQNSVAIQAELCGPGIQKNKMGYTELKLKVFNLVITSENRYGTHDELVQFCSDCGLEMVTVFGTSLPIPQDMSVADMLSIAADVQYPNGTPAEGLVWRPVGNKQHYSEVLKDRMSFKTISNKFLELYKE